jgi:hypothetical protein
VRRAQAPGVSEEERYVAESADIAKVILGTAVWSGVAVFAVVLAANEVGALMGVGGTFLAVLIAWAIGERVVHPEEV